MAHVYTFLQARRCVSAELQERVHHDITYAPSSGVRCVISSISRNLRALPLTSHDNRAAAIHQRLVVATLIPRQQSPPRMSSTMSSMIRDNVPFRDAR